MTHNVVLAVSAVPDNKMRELTTVAVAVVSIIAMLVGYNLYTHAENTKAYYTCLQVVENVAQQQNNSDSGIRIVSMPTCSIR
jgi:cytochrome c-type biogenesis protein CcmE